MPAFLYFITITNNSAMSTIVLLTLYLCRPSSHAYVTSQTGKLIALSNLQDGGRYSNENVEGRSEWTPKDMKTKLRWIECLHSNTKTRKKQAFREKTRKTEEQKRKRQMMKNSQ